MPRLVRITTPSRFSGSGPNMLTNAPSMVDKSDGMRDNSLMASVNPPLFTSTATMTATMPSNMTMPCRKSFMTVAM